MASYKTNITEVLKAVGRKDTEYFNHMNEEMVKSLNPYVLFLWTKYSDDPNQPLRVVLSNELINDYLFALQKDPILLYKLVAVTHGLFGQTFFTYKKKERKNESFGLSIVQEYYGLSEDDARDSLRCLSRNDLYELGIELGYDSSELNKKLG